ncbi:MAG: AMP-binding protein [Myxococcales bacterium]|nr:AMP-binding protein [Myxococcales bacterium]
MARAFAPLTAVSNETAAPAQPAALRIGEASLSRPALAAAIAAYGRWLVEVGSKPGDVIAVATEPTLDACVALIGTLLHNRVALPLDPALGAVERAHIVNDAKPTLLVSGATSSWAASADDADAMLPSLPDADRPALLLYTSGTTGAPKGVMLTQRNLATNLRDLAAAWRLSPQDQLVHALPLFHVHGLVLGLYGGVFFTRGLHWLPKFRPELLLAALAESAPGHAVLYAVPTMYTRLLDYIEAAATPHETIKPLAQARLLVSGSAPLPMREHERMQRLTGRGIVERYGMTETLITCAVTAEAPDPGWVGPPLPSVALRLVDEHGAEVARDGETFGEIQVRGPSIFSGYMGLPEATTAALQDGWFVTGDVACQRADGSIKIVGRTSTDIIKCGGYKVGAGEVEAALLTHPAVAEAAVFALPDRDLGELVAAAIVPRDLSADEAELAAELTTHVASVLSAHKRPRRIVVLPALPRNAMGKVQKKHLAALCG